MIEAIIKTQNIGYGNTFEPGVIIGEEVRIGNNNVFRSGTIIDRKVNIGNNNLFSNYVVIGCQGEMGLKGDIIPADGCIEIGNDNIIREFVVIGFPAKTLLTKVGNNNYFMARSHIPHDCRIGNKVTMAPNSVLGGGAALQRAASLPGIQAEAFASRIARLRDAKVALDERRREQELLR